MRAVFSRVVARRGLVGLVLACGLGVTGVASGCSSGSTEAAAAAVATQQATPQGTVQAWYRALGAKDSATACALMSSDGSPLSGSALTQCTDGLTKVIGLATDAPADLNELTNATVTGATVDGSSAQVAASQITGLPDGFAQDISLVQVGGRWYVDSDALSF